MLYLMLKRTVDLTFSIAVLILLSPVYLLLIGLIKIDSRGPVFFKQKRVGKNKKYFIILKFRTMKIDTPKDMPTHLLSDPGKYITRIGRFLRKSSLDELPQIWNIAVGEMSLIGPRPALWNQTELISERDEYGANDIRPGLTGWAQVNGRDELTDQIKAKFDGEYVNSMSFRMDIKCFFLTILGVLRGSGIVEGGTVDKS